MAALLKPFALVAGLVMAIGGWWWITDTEQLDATTSEGSETTSTSKRSTSEEADDDSPFRPALDLSPRPDDAPGGREVVDGLSDLDLDDAEAEIVRSIERGNAPDFMRRLVPVTIRAPSSPDVTLWVTPDYLSVGSNEDYVRVPLRAATAEKLAHQLKAVLPTKLVVDRIHRQAAHQLPPKAVVGEPATRWMREAIVEDRAIDELFRRFEVEPGELVAGHMKDVIITPALSLHPQKVAIYGMHRRDGEPVQPLSVLHDDGYVDYSHGIRLVAETARIDGEEVSLREVLPSERRSAALSPEGPIELPAYAED